MKNSYYDFDVNQNKMPSINASQFSLFPIHQQQHLKQNINQTQEHIEENLHNFIENWQMEKIQQSEGQEETKNAVNYSYFDQNIFKSNNFPDQDLEKIYSNKKKQRQFEQINNFNLKISKTGLSPDKFIKEAGKNVQYNEDRHLLNQKKISFKTINKKYLVIYTILQSIILGIQLYSGIQTGSKLILIILLGIKICLCFLHPKQICIQRIKVLVFHLIDIIFCDIFWCALIFKGSQWDQIRVFFLIALLASDVFFIRQLIKLTRIQKKLDVTSQQLKDQQEQEDYEI